jgi:hypothetical protein
VAIAAFNKTHLTESAVIVPSPAGTVGATAPAFWTVHTFNINNAAATAVISLYDYNSTTTPPASALVAQFTAPAALAIPPDCMILDAVFTIGITVIIATAAADITVTWI